MKSSQSSACFLSFSSALISWFMSSMQGGKKVLKGFSASLRLASAKLQNSRAAQLPPPYRPGPAFLLNFKPAFEKMFDQSSSVLILSLSKPVWLKKASSSQSQKSWAAVLLVHLEPTNGRYSDSVYLYHGDRDVLDP